MRTLPSCLLLFLCSGIVMLITADDIDRIGRRGVVLKLLREMVNQTSADTLNLPANASSIRENITDTFSCENRTYGYYADVDNECQIFHVCLPSQSPSGRSLNYRWSFICPNETLFNQEVLTCTRPRDSIPCEESPMFYHLNDEIGKVPNDTDTQMPSSESINNNDGNTNMRRRKPVKKQNLIVENLMKEVMKDDLAVESFREDFAPVVEETLTNPEETPQPNQEVYKESEFDDIMMAPDVAEVMESPDRIKIPTKPIYRELVKKSNKKNKDTMKPLAAMVRPEKESDGPEKPNNMSLEQMDTEEQPQEEINVTPLEMKPDSMKNNENEESMANTKPMVFKPVKDIEMGESNKELFKVIPQKENINNINANAKPAKENKVINTKEAIEVNNIKPSNTQSNDKAYISSPHKLSKDDNQEGARKQIDQMKSDENFPVTIKKPEIHEVNVEYKMKGKRMENSRLASERSLRRKGKKISRGSIRFRADKF